MQSDLSFLSGENITQRQEQFNVLLIGDCCVDEYQYGRIDRISPEAPVPVFSYDHSVYKNGMAYNVKDNLERLGCTVTLMTKAPSTKCRLIDIRTNHHVARIDRDVISTPITISSIPEHYDAVVISDYNKGAVSYELLELLSSMNFCQVPVFVDTKKPDLARIKHAFVKVNETEYSRATSLCNSIQLIVTKGSEGAMYDGKHYPVERVAVTDVCGAGDTFMAALVYYTLKTSRIDHAIEMANKAAAITVQHVGTYAPTRDQIEQ